MQTVATPRQCHHHRLPNLVAGGQRVAKVGDPCVTCYQVHQGQDAPFLTLEGDGCRHLQFGISRVDIKTGGLNSLRGLQPQEPVAFFFRRQQSIAKLRETTRRQW